MIILLVFQFLRCVPACTYSLLCLFLHPRPLPEARWVPSGFLSDQGSCPKCCLFWFFSYLWWLLSFMQLHIKSILSQRFVFGSDFSFHGSAVLLTTMCRAIEEMVLWSTRYQQLQERWFLLPFPVSRRLEPRHFCSHYYSRVTCEWVMGLTPIRTKLQRIQMEQATLSATSVASLHARCW